MNLNDLLIENQPTIIKKWFAAVTDTYPPDTAAFLKKEKDPFANPVGSTVAKELESIFNHLLKGGDSEEINAFLDRIIRIRAVQNFAPSQALAFLPMLKNSIRDVLGKKLDLAEHGDDLFDLDEKIDGLTLIAFDVYMDCREELYRISAHEIRKQSERIWERFGLLDGEDSKPEEKKLSQQDGNNEA